MTPDWTVFVKESIKLAIRDFDTMEKNKSLYGMTQDLVIMQKTGLEQALAILEKESKKL